MYTENNFTNLTSIRNTLKVFKVCAMLAIVSKLSCSRKRRF
jgi:hypothetical protein